MSNTTTTACASDASNFEPLFARMRLEQYLDIIRPIVIDRWMNRKELGSASLFLEFISTEYRIEPLKLTSEFEWLDSRARQGEADIHEFAVGFSGNPSLWNMSPVSSAHTIPPIQDYMFLEVMGPNIGQGLRGVVLEDRLLFTTSPHASPVTALGEIQYLIDLQRETIADWLYSLEIDIKDLVKRPAN